MCFYLSYLTIYLHHFRDFGSREYGKVATIAILNVSRYVVIAPMLLRRVWPGILASILSCKDVLAYAFCWVLPAIFLIARGALIYYFLDLLPCVALGFNILKTFFFFLILILGLILKLSEYFDTWFRLLLYWTKYIILRTFWYKSWVVRLIALSDWGFLAWQWRHTNIRFFPFSEFTWEILIYVASVNFWKFLASYNLLGFSFSNIFHSDAFISIID